MRSRPRRPTSSGAAYVSPAPGAAVGRTDQGVDYATRAGQRIVAIGNAVVEFVGRYSGFGNYVAYRLTSGPAAGQEIFTAEFGQPIVRRGQRIRRGQTIGFEATGTPSGIEAGFAQRGGSYLPLAQVEPGGYSEGDVTAAGRRFRNLLYGGGSDSATNLEQLWIEAGGKPAKARIMAAIALAESGGRVDAEGGPNDDGSYDYGLWEINSSHGYNPARLKSDPLYNAQAAVAVERSQGLGAWTTYRSGAYRRYLQQASGATVSGEPRSRPGGESADPGAAAGEAQLASWEHYLNPENVPFLPTFPGEGLLLGGWNPLTIFSDAKNAVEDVGTFLKWIAWLFHPRNILRVVEFTSGAGLMGLGLWSSIKSFEGSQQQQQRSPGRVVRRAFRITPTGRAIGVRQAATRGRRQAREQRNVRERTDAQKRARRSEETRLANRESSRRGRGPSQEIPF